MQIGIVGLGRMGGNIARRLMCNGHACTVFERRRDAVATLIEEGERGAKGLEEMVRLLARPRVVWLMLPAADAATEDAMTSLGGAMEPGDIVIDGGNSFCREPKPAEPKTGR